MHARTTCWNSLVFLNHNWRLFIVLLEQKNFWKIFFVILCLESGIFSFFIKWREDFSKIQVSKIPKSQVIRFLDQTFSFHDFNMPPAIPSNHTGGQVYLWFRVTSNDNDDRRGETLRILKMIFGWDFIWALDMKWESSSYFFHLV